MSSDAGPQSQMIVPDYAHLPQSIAEWQALVDAVGKATDDTRAEKTWLELKGPLDVGSAEGKFTATRPLQRLPWTAEASSSSALKPDR